MERENKSDVILDIPLPEQSGGSLIGVYLKIIFAPVVFFLVFLLGFLDVLSFKVGLHTIIMMSFLLIIALIFARHNADYGCRLFEDRIDLFKKELKDYIMSHLVIIGNRKKSNASFEDFTDDFVRDVRNENYSSVASGIFPMLGILGTFISIAISMPAFSSTNINALEGEIAQLLGGVGTAFYVSIYGIFLALWWIYFEKRGLSRFQRIIFKYQNATRNFFWQQQEITQGYIQELIFKNERLNQIMANATSDDFSKNLTKSLREKQARFDEILSLEEESIATLKEQLNRAKEQIDETIAIQSAIFEGYDKTILSVENLSKNILKLQNDIAKEFKFIMSFNSQKTQNLEDAVSSLEDKFRELIDIIEKNKDDLSAIYSKGAIEIKDELDEFKDELKQSVITFDNSDVIEDLKRSLASVEEEKRDS